MAALWPLATRLASRRLGIGPTTLRTTSRACDRAFDAIAERLADGRPRLCGERFTAADLTFACLAVVGARAARVRGPAAAAGRAARATSRATSARFREHPAGAYALELFRTERRSPVAQA